MLLANRFAQHAETILFGDLSMLETVLFKKALDAVDISRFKDQRVVLKGCGDVPVPVSAYVDFTSKLTAVAKSIMYGEPCSTVPIFKRKD